GRNRCIRAPSCVRKAIRAITSRAYQRPYRTEFVSGFSTTAAISDCLAVSRSRAASHCFALVENIIEENDSSGNLVTPKGLEFIEVVYDDDIGRNAGFGGRRIP